MAVIYLRHPDHGAKVAISDMEADSDRLNGWEDFDPAVLDVSQSTEEVIEAPVESVNELQPRRRGRRPREIM